MKTSAGSLLEIHAHEIDFMRWVCGDVAAVVRGRRNLCRSQARLPDLALVTMHFASGAKGMLHVGQVSVVGGYGGRVDCEGGSLVFPAFWGAEAGIQVGKAGEPTRFIPSSEIKVEEPVTHELRDFIDAILSGTPAPVPGEVGRAAVEVGLASYRSIQTGRTVKLPL